ncbi:glycoside hydrolase family 26 protein [Variovorax sp. HJSM1_2]|uniref:glycoside hydrolase family 26 protein n=1 Tax=Variovorax sp. HJSM1_2 TaxID=3366263 RepID=UPI003BBE728B
MNLKTFITAAAFSICGVFTSNAGAAELGAYMGGGCYGVSKLDGYSAWLGHRPTRGIDFLAAETWVAMEAAAARSAKCWKPTNLDMTFSVPMLTTDKTTTLEAGAAGAYDEHFKTIAKNLITNGYGNASIRIGWEFNYSWFPWAAKKNPTAWVAYWKRIVTAMRSEHGANFTFDWCVGSGPGDINPADVYPGDQYVDTVGMDIYNTTWATVPQTTMDRWKYRMNKPVGFIWHRDFAALHGKKMTYGEWGTGTRPDGHGLGDDPEFIQLMADWIKSNNVAWHHYWEYNAKDFAAKLNEGQFPLSATAFKQNF